MKFTREDVLRVIDSTPDERLVSAVLELMAEAWSDGKNLGTSRAMRHMSDEPALELASESDNPYRSTT